jgi:hypothetical protein
MQTFGNRMALAAQVPHALRCMRPGDVLGWSARSRMQRHVHPADAVAAARPSAARRLRAGRLPGRHRAAPRHHGLPGARDDQHALLAELQGQYRTAALEPAPRELRRGADVAGAHPASDGRVRSGAFAGLRCRRNHRRRVSASASPTTSHRGRPARAAGRLRPALSPSRDVQVLDDEGQPVAGGAIGEIVRARPRRVRRLLARARTSRPRCAERLAAHRRPRARGRRGLHLHRRPQEGDAGVRRLQRLSPARSRRCSTSMPAVYDVCVFGGARRQVGRNREGRGGAARRGAADDGEIDGLLPRPAGRLQAAALGRLRAATAQERRTASSRARTCANTTGAAASGASTEGPHMDAPPPPSARTAPPFEGSQARANSSGASTPSCAANCIRWPQNTASTTRRRDRETLLARLEALERTGLLRHHAAQGDGRRWASVLDHVLIKEVSSTPAARRSHRTCSANSAARRAWARWPEAGHALTRWNASSCPWRNAEKAICFAITEPEAGSDAGAVQTRAVREGDHWVLNGTKRFISGSPICDFARDHRVDQRRPGRARDHGLLRRRDQPGFRVERATRPWPASRTPANIVLEDCRVPAAT